MKRTETKCRIADKLFYLLLLVSVLSSCKSTPKDIIPSAEYAPYVSAYTGGVISQNSSIRIELAQDQPMVDLNNELKDNPFSFSPSLKGKAYWISNNTIEFVPEEGALKPGKFYEATFQLGDFVEVESRLKEFNFSFRVQERNFTLHTEPITVTATQPNVVNVKGELRFSDTVKKEEVEKILSAYGNGKKITVNITATDNPTRYQYEINSIPREAEDYSLKITANGSPAGIDLQQEDEILIPAKNKFQFLSAERIDQPENGIEIVFSNPISVTQDLKGLIEIPEISPILGSEKTQFYRNKLEYTFSNKRWLTYEEVQQNVVYEQMNAVGFHIPNAFDKVLAIEKCWLQDDISNRIRNAVRDYAYEHNYSFINLRSQEGMLRNMIVRTSSTGELMVILICKIEKDEEMVLFKNLLQYVADKFPEITSLLYIINNKCNDTITDLDVYTFKGNDHIFEEMEGLRFKVGPKSFYQTNSDQAYNLYKITRNFAGLTGNELVYDLYTGTGTIANFVAKQARQVIGIEYVPEAIEDAKVNAEINGIKNTLFFAGDMKDMLTQDFINQYGRPDVIITDPPRAGMHQDVVDVILFAEPKRIVYVSCNPATQARDLQLLDIKYKVTAVQPVDMFPHTHHVENVVLLEIKN